MAERSLIQDFHRRKPGAARAVFGGGKDDAGRSSYQRLIDQRIPSEHRRILDLGCGDGTLLLQLLEQSPDAQLSGADLSAAELSLARQRLPDTVTLAGADARSLPFADASMDMVLCHMAFMLMEDLDEVVAELSRVLRPGGLFAAIVGRSASNQNSALVFSMFQQLAKQEQLNMSIGDPRYHSAAVADWFPSGPWLSPSTQDFTLTVERPLAQFFPFLESAYYGIDLLSPAGKQSLTAHVDRLSSILAPQGVVRWQFPMSLLRVERAS